MPHYQSLKPTIRLTFLNLLTATRFSQCNIITIEYQIIHLSDVIVLSFRDLAFICSLEFLNTGCPKSSFIYFISLYFSTIGLGKQIVETKFVFHSNSPFSYLLCHFLTRILDLCTSAPNVLVRENIYMRYICLPSNAQLVSNL